MRRFGPGLVLVLAFGGYLAVSAGLAASVPTSALFGILVTVLLLVFAAALFYNALRRS